MPDRRHRLGIVLVAPARGPITATEGPGTEADAGDLQVGRAEYGGRKCRHPGRLPGTAPHAASATKPGAFRTALPFRRRARPGGLLAAPPPAASEQSRPRPPRASRT